MEAAIVRFYLDAIERAGDAGILFVAAAGNSGSDNDTSRSIRPTTGARVTPTARRAATTAWSASPRLTDAGGLASYSNHGATSVDLAAPGSNITSTVPLNSYAAYSGTSMATPHVTGALALCRRWAASAGRPALGGDDLGRAHAGAHGQDGERRAPPRGRRGRLVNPSDEPVSRSPSGLSASALGTRSVSLTWVNQTGLSGFEVERANAPWHRLRSLRGTREDRARRHQLDRRWSAPGDENICFRVRAANSFGGGAIGTGQCRGVELPAMPAYACSPTGYTWTNASGPGYALSDDGTARINLGQLEFAFYGEPATWFDVSANGFLGIGAETVPPARGRNSAALAGQPNEIVAAWWDDLNPNNETHVWTPVVGSAPNRVFVVEWRDIRPFVAGAAWGVAFEIRLDEATDAITFSYKDVSAGLASVRWWRRAPRRGSRTSWAPRGRRSPWMPQVWFPAPRLAVKRLEARDHARHDSPAALAPSATLGSPSVLGAEAKVRLAWPAASDPSGIAAYDVQYRVGSGGWTSIGLASPTSLAVDFNVTPRKAYAFRVGARDGAGDIGWSPSSSVQLALRQETDTHVTYSVDSSASTWTVHLVARLNDGCRRADCPADISPAGSAFVTTRAPARGIAQVWLDGEHVATLDLYAAARQTRVLAWSAAVPAGNHVLKIG